MFITPESTLQNFFGLKNFKKPQKEIINWVLKKNHCLIILPTSFGKSLCYQIPALMKKEGLTLVVSPLIALMKDQVDSLKQKQVPAEALHSALSKEKRQSILKNIEKYRLLYVTPERFQKEEFSKIIKKQNISLMAIDEAHSISKWGQDFRPDYSRLGEVRKKLKNPPTIALTATASSHTKEDILKSLNLSPKTKIFKQSINRPNLYFAVFEAIGMENKILKLKSALSKHQPAIVYFSLIHTLEKTSQDLKSLKIPFLKYHSKIPAKVRHQNQEDFLNGKVPIMLATPAFGLGINKKNIRLVAHFEIPGSIESYYQEAGRAGRDQNESFCFLYYDEDDLSIGMDFIKWSNPSLSFIKRVFWIIQNKKDEVKSFGVNYIREQMNFHNPRDFRVETAINLLRKWNYLLGETNKLSLSPDPLKIWPEPSFLKEKEKHQLIHLKNILEYAKNSECRKKILAQYFGEDIPACGFCDNCT